MVPDVFVPETNDAYEIGAKNYFLGRSLRLDIAAFYYVHHDFQYIEYDPVPFDSGIANIPRIHDYGVEFEGQYVALAGHLHIDGSLALENGKVIGRYKTIDSTVANAIEYAPPCYSPYNPACYPRSSPAPSTSRAISRPTCPASPARSAPPTASTSPAAR